MTEIAPGGTIGILGGGQLGRMTALAARSMGYRVHALDPDPECPAKPVVDRCITARFDDADAAAELARHCDVITLEIEQIADASLAAASAHAPVRPGAGVLGIVRDRGQQRAWLASQGFPQGAHAMVSTLEELDDAAARLGPLFVKATFGGYDGRSQARVPRREDAAQAWASLGGRAAVAERALDLDAELSVLVARTPSGRTAVYTPARNHHEKQVLAWASLPGEFDPQLEQRATALATAIADAIGLEGILAVEMFVTRDGELLVNELAPRPHNSYHTSEPACATSQFEQLVRAVCDLPLGSTDVLRPGAIVNIFGDLWRGDSAPRWPLALDEAHVRLHLYGKASARPGRKMGHLSATGATPAEALDRARRALSRLEDPTQAAAAAAPRT
jgi:5-(carboxyamino)imidazole ribonucleotide synthase